MKYSLGQTVSLIESQETGTITGRAEYLANEPTYYVRYRAADGRQTEAWWSESAIGGVVDCQTVYTPGRADGT